MSKTVEEAKERLQHKNGFLYCVSEYNSREDIEIVLSELERLENREKALEKAIIDEDYKHREELKKSQMTNCEECNSLIIYKDTVTNKNDKCYCERCFNKGKISLDNDINIKCTSTAEITVNDVILEKSSMENFVKSTKFNGGI